MKSICTTLQPRRFLERACASWGFGAVLALATAGKTAAAHHSFEMFDMHKTVTITGQVRDYQWTNPHVWIDMLVTDPSKSQPVLIAIEGDSTFILARRGWTRNSVKPGDVVAALVHPLRSGSVGGSLVSATANGKVVGHPFNF